ncbi:hypothetical protein P8935_17240 [Telmatobacter sp. DSM 110680]|uniref:Secreted protein n=1 Tax=Telmatobacter sp. DSM 110680 TaxID=3036704 RepID=A0AAU7DHN3_9BACT
MKARVTFYFAAVVALVLFLASMQSHATERRDPFIIQDTPQTQAARSTSIVRATALATKPAQSSQRKRKATSGALKTGLEGVNARSGEKKTSIDLTAGSEPSTSAGGATK